MVIKRTKNGPRVIVNPNSMRSKTKRITIGKASKTPKTSIPKSVRSLDFGKRLENASDNYLAARLRPFSPDAYGAKVPDDFAGNTVTATLHQSITSTPGSTITDIFVFPSALFSVGSTVNIGGGATFTCGDNSGTISYVGWSSSNLNARMQSYRIVGMGVRVTCDASMTAASGRVIIGTIPIDNYIIGKTFPIGGVTMGTNASLTKTQTLTEWGLPNSGGNVSPSLLSQIPDAQTFSMLELAETELEIVPKLCDPRAYEFRQTVDGYAGANIAYQTAAGNSGNADYLQCNGFEAVVIAVDGATSSTPLQVEVIYHLEGAPSTTAGVSSGISSILDAGASRSPVNPIALMKTNMLAAAQPMIRKVAVGVADLIHPSLGQFVSAII